MNDYLARNVLMDRREVLKVVNKALLDRPGVAERFLREIRSAAMLRHNNVVQAYSAVQASELLLFAIEYVDGEDLDKVVQRQGPLPIQYACHYVSQAALGLQHAHEHQMVHRDVKPQNLILSRQGKKHIVKVLDFGLAKAKREGEAVTDLTGVGAMMGTPAYMAPEQAQDAASADIRADIYSLGCTLYFLLTGAPPFTGKSVFAILQAHVSTEPTPLGRLRPEVPAELSAVVAKMMTKDPANRYKKPIEAAQALAPFIKPGAVPAEPIKTGAPVPAATAGQAEVRKPNEPAPAAASIFNQPTLTAPDERRAAAVKAAARGGRPVTRKGSNRRSIAAAFTVLILLAVGVLLLLLVGGGVLAYLGIANHWFSPAPSDTQTAATDPTLPEGDVPLDVDDAMLWIRTAQTADKQNRASDWLAQATVIGAKQKDVATMLEKLALNANTHDSAIKALSQWAGPEDVQTLLTAVEIDDGLWLGDKAGGAPASALIRLQADGAAAAFAHRLTSPFSHESAKKLLAQLGGPKAEKDVLKYMDSPNNEARNDAQDLLRVFGTKPEVMFDQAVADLKNLDSGYRQWACDYISKQPVDNARQAEVAKALIGPLGDGKPETRAAAAAALATWATKDDEPALIAELEQDMNGNSDFQSCLDALVQLKDENGAEAIAKQLKSIFHREKAFNALRAMGKVAEKAVAGYKNDSDVWVSEHANLLLTGYGMGSDVVFDAELADLTGKDGKQRKGACDYFATHPVDPAKQQQVARALEGLLDDKDDFFNKVPDAAAKALGVWGDKDTGPKLLATMQREMQKPGSTTWEACADALVKLKDKRAVYPLLSVAASKDNFHKQAALRALNQMGPMLVEEALDDDLNDPSATVQDRVAICAYLNLNGGTKASIPALTTASMDTNALVKNAATGALNAIKKRKS